jgi:transcriptional regulator with XRE-family HTH domain
MFGDRLRKLRKERHLTQKALAAELSISRSALSLYESDKREPDFDTLTKIADFFDTSLDYLLSRDKEAHTNSDYTMPDYITDVLRDPDVSQALDKLKTMSASEKKSLAAHLYALAYIRKKEDSMKK